MLRALALRLADLEQELQLLRSVVVLLLLDAAVDHAIERQEEGLVTLGSPLVGLVRGFIFALEAPLVAHLRLVRRVLRL